MSDGELASAVATVGMETGGLDHTSIEPLRDIIDEVAKRTLHQCNGATTRIRQIRDTAALADVGRFRQLTYRAQKPYMLQELDDDGLDRTDARALVFAAYQGEEIVASLRLRTSPFDTEQHMDAAALERFLRPDQAGDYLEFSRLLVSRDCLDPQVGRHLIHYAGLIVLNTTPYRCYFGYVDQRLAAYFVRRFGVTAGRQRFRIPRRGSHDYVLVKGDFLADFRRRQFSDEILNRLPLIRRRLEQGA